MINRKRLKGKRKKIELQKEYEKEKAGKDLQEKCEREKVDLQIGAR
jgi:hypothetical protein